MQRKEFKIESIKQDLIQFGLNPKEWVLGAKKPATTGSVLLENKADQEFKLLGLWENQGGDLHLKELSLLSL